ncbi:MAG TPA: hypothetical protein VF456_08205 [Vicinamibacterales bacterium]
MTVPSQSAGKIPAVLWQEPNGTRGDLFYGPGGPGHRPDTHETFTFVHEDLEGSHPKFEVVDGRGVHWKVKLGDEARPETVATRLVWAAGFAADEDYFADEIHVDNMPARLHRGQHLIEPNGVVRNVRLKRTSHKRREVGIWTWRQNPFTGTRELNGLRVLMALINNWDLKDINNAIYEESRSGDDGVRERVFEVKDLGLSFGSTGLEPTTRSNGNLEAYRKTSFITHVTPETVTFATPRRPDWIVLANAPQFFKRLKLLWIGRNIPRADARWIGSVLSEIPPDSIRDAFRAAGYSPNDVEGFTTVVESRIHQLNSL